MAEVKKRHGWFSRLTFGTVSLALGGLLALSYVSVLVNPAKAWFFTIFGLLFIPVLVLTVLFFIWALFRRSRMTGFLLVMILPAIFIGLTFHEFAHAFVAYKLGDQTPKLQGRVTLNPMAHIDLVGLLCLFFVQPL